MAGGGLTKIRRGYKKYPAGGGLLNQSAAYGGS